MSSSGAVGWKLCVAGGFAPLFLAGGNPWRAIADHKLGVIKKRAYFGMLYCIVSRIALLLLCAGCLCYVCASRNKLSVARSAWLLTFSRLVRAAAAAAPAEESPCSAYKAKENPFWTFEKNKKQFMIRDTLYHTLRAKFQFRTSAVKHASFVLLALSLFRSYRM